MKNKLARIFCTALFVMLLSIATFAGIMDTDVTGQQATPPPSTSQSATTDGATESVIAEVVAIIETAFSYR